MALNLAREEGWDLNHVHLHLDQHMPAVAVAVALTLYQDCFCLIHQQSKTISYVIVTILVYYFKSFVVY